MSTMIEESAIGDLNAAPRFDWKTLVGRQWIVPTLLILLGMAGLAQLGFWQLDRLEWRRGENQRIQTQLGAPPIALNLITEWDEADAWHDRQAQVTGVFEYGRQVGVKNRFYKSDPGIHLLTPFHIAGSERVLMVDRGWIPLAMVTEDWSQFNESGEEVEISGLLQKSASMSLEERGYQEVEVPADNLWYREDLTALQGQFEESLEPMFLLQQPVDGAEPGWPRRTAKAFELSEGNHLSYAIQWFCFSLILGIGYVLMVRRKVLERNRNGPRSASG